MTGDNLVEMGADRSSCRGPLATKTWSICSRPLARSKGPRSSTSPTAVPAVLVLSSLTRRILPRPQLVCLHRSPDDRHVAHMFYSQVHWLPVRWPPSGHHLRQIPECRPRARRYDGGDRADRRHHAGPDHVICKSKLGCVYSSLLSF